VYTIKQGVSASKENIMKTGKRKIPKYEDKVLTREEKRKLKRLAWLKIKQIEGGKKQDGK